MKKLICAILILSLILTFAVGLFACKDEKGGSTAPDKDALATRAVAASFPSGREDEGEIATALITLLENAELEDAEIISVLKELITMGEALSDTLIDIANNSFSLNHAKNYQIALQAISSATSPEIAGKVFYAAALKTGETLPYSLSDVERIAALLLGQEDSGFGSDLVEKLMDGEAPTISEKQINTMMITLVASLRKAIGLSDDAKEYLYTLITNTFSSDLFKDTLEDLDQGSLDAIDQSKNFIESFIKAFFDGYDVILSFTADFLAQADAELFLGLPYTKEERIVYYGYNYSDGEHFLTENQYNAREGDYDEYFTIESTVKGFIVEGEFIPISDKDASLADRVYRLYTAYKTYSLLDAEGKQSFRDTLDAMLTILSDNQETIAVLLKRDLREDDGVEGASFDDMVTALSTLSAFSPKDGVSDAERSTATTAIACLESFLHGYLPLVY